MQVLFELLLDALPSTYGPGVWWENIKNDVIKELLARESLGVKAEEQGGINEEFADRDGSRKKK